MESTNNEFQEEYSNEAKVESYEEISCEDCYEQVIFLLKDKDHEFSVGMHTILECLAFAIENGDLPKLPRSWLRDVDKNYHIGISENENISYSDHRTMI